MGFRDTSGHREADGQAHPVVVTPVSHTLLPTLLKKVIFFCFKTIIFLIYTQYQNTSLVFVGKTELRNSPSTPRKTVKLSKGPNNSTGVPRALPGRLWSCRRLMRQRGGLCQGGWRDRGQRGLVGVKVSQALPCQPPGTQVCL